MHLLTPFGSKILGDNVPMRSLVLAKTVNAQMMCLGKSTKLYETLLPCYISEALDVLLTSFFNHSASPSVLCF